MGMVPSSIPTHDEALERSFRRVAEVTGGAWYPARDAGAAMRVVEAVAAKVFSDVEIDRRVWAELAQSYAAADVTASQSAASGPSRLLRPRPSRCPARRPRRCERRSRDSSSVAS